MDSSQSSTTTFYSSIPGESFANSNGGVSGWLRFLVALLPQAQSPMVLQGCGTIAVTLVSLLLPLMFLLTSFNQFSSAALSSLVVVLVSFSLREQMAKVVSLLKRVSLLRRVPTVEGSWLSGHAKLLNPDISLPNWRRWVAQHPRILRLHRLPLDDFIVVHHPDSVNKVLRSSVHPREQYIYSFLQPWLGSSLVTNCAPDCAARRKLLAPALSARHSARRGAIYRASIAELDTVWDARLSAAADGERPCAVVDVQEAMCLLSLDVILRCAYSYSSHCQRAAMPDDSRMEQPAEDVVAYARAVPKLLSMIVDRLLAITHHVDAVYWRTTAGKLYTQLVRTAHSFTHNQIAKRQRQQEESDTESEDSDDQVAAIARTRSGEDFLSILQKAHSSNNSESATATQHSSSSSNPLQQHLVSRVPGLASLSAEALHALESDLETLVFAGHDTTATAMSWVLHYLAVHPDAQQKCYKEISHANACSGGCESDSAGTHTTTASSDSDNSSASVSSSASSASARPSRQQQQLPYLLACVKEAMRLASVVPFIHRRLGEDMVIDGYTLPRDTRIMVSLWGLHHNPAVWARPEEFLPERFLTASDPRARDLTLTPNATRDAFLPFSVGSRSCLGQRMAMEEVVSLLSLLIARYEFSSQADITGPEPQPYPTIVMHSKNGIRLLVTKRDA
eukprot:scpid37105/ scgid13375/ Leukotriene-B(4) omega-hydroxylase 1; CYPIVF2; Cytochrome P450 4F2; Cytochrome P450-LTB-omega; Leukotriene-B(4) 20-monooxygenase 1